MSPFTYEPWERQEAAQRGLTLLVVSFLGLFLEIMLIRWLGAEIRVFAYLKNFALIACFFGLGLGFALSRRSFNSYPLFPLLLLLVVVLVTSLAPYLHDHLRQLPAAEDVHIWGLKSGTDTGRALLFYLVVSGAFLLITFLFLPLGQLTGRLMTTFAPLSAYTLNLSGAVLGIATFSLLSFLETGPSVWLGLASGLAVLLLRRPWAPTVLGFLLLAAAVVISGDAGQNVRWSPYQRIEIRAHGRPVPEFYTLEANQDYHQRILNLSKRNVRRSRNPVVADLERAYQAPYLFKSAPEDVLVLGAGSGNDVAAALRNGARRVDAVEIDPVIVEIGRRLHPERPYQSDRVEVRIGDARAFIRKADRRYDLIVFGLVDSHTMLSGRSEVRLDNFLYTLESLREARALLKADGVIALTFSIPRAKPWLAVRLRDMLEASFGEEPLCQHLPLHGVLFVVGADPPGGALSDWDYCSTSLADQPAVSLAMDDWPYLYLRDRSVPPLYFSVIAIAIAISLVLVLRLVPETKQFDGHFFFLGAAFLLVEVKAVTELALVFGTTWLVNSVVIVGILLLALGANLWVQKSPPFGIRTAYLLLLASLALGYFFPKELLLDLSLPVGGSLATLLLSLPVLFAGIIFSSSLEKAPRLESAFGSNLLGAMVGGFFEYSSLAFGVRSLYLLAMVFYTLSWLLIRRGEGGRC